MTFLETVMPELNRMRAFQMAAGGYEGVTHAGLLVVARDSGAMLLAQRAPDPDDDPEVAETWEFPGGSLEDGEDPYLGALREFNEEVGADLGEHEVVHGWRAGDDGHYQGFVVAVSEPFALDPATADPEEVQNVAWATPEEAATLNLRPEVAALDLEALVATAVSGNEEADMPEDDAMVAATQVGTAEEYLRTDEDGDELARVEAMVSEEPLLTMADIAPVTIPIHGVLAPEDVESGDGRGFNAGAMTSRPLRLPFRWQKVDIGGHDGAVTTGSVDRLMRKDGLIHWEGQLMMSADAEEFLDLLIFMGRYGVSVDGDRGSLDSERSRADGVTWFNAVRASGLTAVAIPAFSEAYVALGPHPDMPADNEPETLTAAGIASDDVVGMSTFDRGPGWVTNPKETKRLHDYWTKPGQPGYEKIRWGVGGDYRRCVAMVGEKIAKNSPEDMRFIKRICAQWHHDALGYWPGDLGKPGNNPEKVSTSSEHEGLAEAVERVERDDIAATENGWEAVLVSSVGDQRPPLDYFHQHPSMVADVWALDSGATSIEDPDEFGFRRVWGFAAEWGVCHVGMNGRCVEPPRTGSDDYPDFHLGITRTSEGKIPTGVLTYGVGHRDAETLLSETPEQAYFDNINNAWAAVRVGENERGIWFSGVVLPGVPEEHIVKIEASGQVSGEWLAGAMRACLTVNVPGFPIPRASVEYDEEGRVLALAASAFGQVPDAPCAEPEVDDPVGDLVTEVVARIEARSTMAQTREKFVMGQFRRAKQKWED